MRGTYDPEFWPKVWAKEGRKQMARTLAQKEANSFDADLYSLINKALAYQDIHDELTAMRGASPSGVNPWREVVGNLYRARPHVRQCMHPEDRKGTEG